MSSPAYETLFLEHRACVLIPTYNNEGTLAHVIDSVLGYTTQVIVINDGSTDSTEDILQQYPDIQVVSYGSNRGKGYALRQGFRAAWHKGYEYAITIDSDGQHYAHDLPRFLEQLNDTRDVLIVGARNMEQEHVPGKSSFGNRFSNFWYWVETGKRLHDTQSGYRLYPLQKLACKHYFTRKYEFEIEVLVRAAWSGILVVNMPVSVYYPPAGERVSHFRPFKDFTRISILNTVLVLISFLWVRPRKFVLQLFRKEGWQKLWQSLFVNPQETNHIKAASVGFGVFMGIVPIWGFQLAIGIPLAIFMRLNKGLFIIAANISVVPLMPFILLTSLITGQWLLGMHVVLPNWHHISLATVKTEGAAFFLGGSVLSVAGGLVAYIITYVVLLFIRDNKPKIDSRL